ncbi:MAG: hypothetical protein LBK64_00290, partial [Spirochaetaceae bacterium]|nr:hypothetical protein [Spirochaetaceae bacterium]
MLTSSSIAGMAAASSEALTWSDYERLLTARYQAGGHAPEIAAHFAQGEIRAILAGNHWTHGKPTAPDPQRLIIEALAPEKPVYQGSVAIKKTLTAGIPLKDFYAKNKDNDPAAYTANVQEIAALWNQGKRRFKAFVRGRFVVVDIDRHPGKADGLE